jgi:hypothetical protein
MSALRFIGLALITTAFAPIAVALGSGPAAAAPVTGHDCSDVGEGYTMRANNGVLLQCTRVNNGLNPGLIWVQIG